MQHRSITRLVALVAAASLTFAACGDDDGDTSTGANPLEPSEQAEKDAAGELGEGCAFLGEFASGFEGAVDPEAFFGNAGDGDLGASFGAVADEFADAADAAPDEIADAIDTMAESFDQAASELEGMSFDASNPEDVDPELFAAFERLEKAFSAEFEAAADEVETYVAENCKG